MYLKLLLYSHLTTAPTVHGAGSLLLPQNFRGGPEGGSYMLVMLTFNKLSYLYLFIFSYMLVMLTFNELSYLYLEHLCAKIMTSRLLSTPHLDLQLLYYHILILCTVGKYVYNLLTSCFQCGVQ